jgi:hypothetical protein
MSIMEPAEDVRAGQGQAQMGSETSKSSIRSFTCMQHIVPGQFDVLCSQSRSSYEHAGNILFKEVIARKLPAYEKAKSKIEKTSFFRHVVNEISSMGGKFLKLDEEKGEWFEVDYASARSKVGKAFRAAVSEQQGSAPQRQDEECDEELQRFETRNEIDARDSELRESAQSISQLGKAPDTVKETQSFVDESKKWTAIVESAKLSYLALSQEMTTSAESSLATSKVVVPLKRPRDDIEIASSQHTTMLSKTPSGSNSQTVPMDVSANVRIEPSAESMLSRRSETNRSSTAREDLQIKSSALHPPHEEPPGFAALNRPSTTPNVHHHGVTPGLARLDIQPIPPISQKSEGEPAFHQRPVTLPIPPPQTVFPGNFKLPGLTRQLPNMLDTRELKRAMYRTLAIRQQALEQNKISQHTSKANAPPNVDLLIGKAMANSKSTQEILQQALEVQKNAVIQGTGLGPDKSKRLTRVTDTAVKNVDQRSDSKHGNNNLSKTRKTAQASSPDFALVSPDSILKPQLPASTLLNLQRIKRPRSSESSSSREPPKKKVSLAEVATEHTIESQKKSGLWYFPSRDAADATASQFYFL